MFNRFKKEKIVLEALVSYKWRFPEKLNVSLKASAEGGYIAYVEDLPGCITQAETGKELFEMVNDAIYTYLQIPEQYQIYMPVFFPPENTRKELNIEIPVKYLKESVLLQRI